MKKFIILAVAAVAAFGANAADNDFAPSKGDFSTEVQFNPFNSDYTFSIDALKGRYFFSDKDALTIQFGINAINRKSVPNTENDAYTSHYNGTFRIGLGYERHFFNYKRIDLYGGANVYYAHRFAQSKEMYDDKNGVRYEGYDNIDGVKSGNGFGFNFFTGLDFYIYKGLYCGVEIALNLEDQLVSNYKKVTISGGQETDDKTKQGGHDFSLNTKVQPLLRLGWRF